MFRSVDSYVSARAYEKRAEGMSDLASDAEPARKRKKLPVHRFSQLESGGTSSVSCYFYYLLFLMVSNVIGALKQYVADLEALRQRDSLHNSCWCRANAKK